MLIGQKYLIHYTLYKGVFKGGSNAPPPPPPEISDFFLKSEGKEVERKREKK